MAIMKACLFALGITACLPPPTMAPEPTCARSNTGLCTACSRCCIPLSSAAACKACIDKRCVTALECDPQKGCSSSVCPNCCDDIFANETDCTACVKELCHGPENAFDCQTHDGLCSADCAKNCWDQLKSPW